MRVVLPLSVDRPRPELKASLELAIAAALAICGQPPERTATRYWREQAAKASAKVDDESKALHEIRRLNDVADDAARAPLDAPIESRFVRLGEIIAASPSFEDWVVARKRGDQFVFLAAARRKTGD